MAEPKETKVRHQDLDVPYSNPEGAAVSSNTVLINRVSWGAIFAGVTVLLITQIILNLVGIGIGAATIDTATGDTPSLTGFSIGAVMWWTITGIFAAFAGGFAASRMAGQPKSSTGAWHGLTTWAFAMLIVFYMLISTAASVAGTAYNAAATTVGGAANMLGGTAQVMVQLAAPALSGQEDPFAQISRQVRQAADEEVTQATIDAAVTALRIVVTGGDTNQTQQARREAARALAEAQDIPLSDAREQIQQYINQYQQAIRQTRQQATELADEAATTIASASLLGALALVLGALAAWFGGRIGTVDPTVLRSYYLRDEKKAAS